MEEFTVTPAQFRDYIAHLDDDQLHEFLAEIIPVMEVLEEDDFFGTEGFDKRFA